MYIVKMVRRLKVESIDFVFLSGLFFLGGFSSFVNVLAGGGSILVLGFMMFFGIEPAVANATNRVGVLISTGSGALAFTSEKFTDVKESLKLGAVALPGAILGAIYSVKISSELFKIILSLIMIFVVITLFLPKSKKSSIDKLTKSRIIYPVMFLVGIYGGFIQVGVGILISATLRHLHSLDLVKMNMHKVFIVFIYTIPVIIVFILSGKINWLYAVVLSAGNAVGSWITVKLAVKKGEKIVKIGMVIAVILMIGNFFYK